MENVEATQEKTMPKSEVILQDIANKCAQLGKTYVHIDSLQQQVDALKKDISMLDRDFSQAKLTESKDQVKS